MARPVLGSALLVLFSISAAFSLVSGDGWPRVCIIGAGIAGSSLSHFLKDYSGGAVDDIVILERNGVAGATILHPKNLHALNFTSFLGLKPSLQRSSASSSWLGIWDGSRFVFQTLPPPPDSSSALYKKIHSILNSFLLFRRYGLSLLRMQSFVTRTVGKFMIYYKDLASRPVFESAEEMLRWAGLDGLTRRTLQEALAEAGLSPLLISELVTVITRINYGQNVDMSGLAGAVGLAGSESGLWSHSNATLNLHEEITSISYKEGQYELRSREEINTSVDSTSPFLLRFQSQAGACQHTHTTFVRGLLNPGYFGLNSESEIPNLVGTMEVPEKYGEKDKAYKVFSRSKMEDVLLDQIFGLSHYSAPEAFAPYILDGLHLYYINSFESAASTMETSAVSAENIARLILSRISEDAPATACRERIFPRESHLHVDL
ncbi:unnamed protein product [Spirodela intermedia]|uniref:Prenylcysteine lyase domain-containing protein n=1 Tax=Spirodela intermedia TaxID=51605 RepID=A0A7I8IRQ1_SPIIN|nr:unnamed protein product [Spirodela intermedia]CAA6660412.1 unnamed protein product [Spirodela intermedia]